MIYIAEDLTEDTFVKLGIKKPKYKGYASFKTWLYTIARNVTRDYIRKNSKYKKISLNHSSEQLIFEHSYIRDEKKIMIHDAMQKLKPEYRQVLWLIYFEEFSYKEIAKIMKKTVHSIETLAYRARKALEQQLIKEGYNENL